MRVDRVVLAAEMARNDYNCNKLIRKSGLSRSTISAIRAGKSCSGESALAIAKALNISLEQLLVKEGESA